MQPHFMPYTADMASLIELKSRFSSLQISQPHITTTFPSIAVAIDTGFMNGNEIYSFCLQSTRL